MADSSHGTSRPHAVSTDTCNYYTGVSADGRAHTDDGLSADRLWAQFAPALAAGGRIRVARDGRNYRRGWERRVDPALRPASPAAVRVYDAAGDATTVGFDLDVGRASRQAVLQDCDRLTRWLTDAGCTFIVDESPSGGRHVYVTLAEPRSHTEIAALAVRIKASRLIPTLDISPLINRSDGCLRPPGAAHRSGGHQQLVTPHHEALTALHHRTSRQAWERFCAALPVPPPTRLDIDIQAPIAAARADIGVRLPLAEPYAQIATTGRYPADRYPSASEARAAVLMHALHRGWSRDQIIAAVATTWTGLAGLYISKYGTRYATKALTADLDRAHARYTDHPLQKSHTSAPHPRGGTRAAAASRIHLRRVLAALDLAIAHGRWRRKSFGIELVMHALVDAARRKQTSFAAFGIRHLAMGAGTVLDPSTVATALRTLRAETDPFLVLVERGSGVDPDLYELRVPDEYIDDLPDELPPMTYGIHPIHGTFESIATFRIVTHLRREPASAPEIAARSQTSVRTVRAVLHELREAGLARRAAQGWVRGRRSLDSAGARRGVRGRLRRLVATWRVERAALRAMLGLPTRVYSTRPIAWPGTRPPTTAAAPLRPPPPPPDVTDPWDDIGTVLADLLGAVEIPAPARSA